MIRESLNDITDEEFNNILLPYYNNFNEYIIKYVIPEVVAFGIASAYERNALWQNSFIRHFNSIKDTFNITIDDIDSVIKDTKKLLEVKYSLIVASDDPLEIKKIKYPF